MKITFSLLTCLLLLTITGCSEDATAPTDASVVTMEVGEGDAGELSEADQTLVAAQKICPVGGGELGGMGTPVKVMVGDRPVFICCEHCREPLLENPEKHLAKLEEAKADATEEASEEVDGGLSAPPEETLPAS